MNNKQLITLVLLTIIATAIITFMFTRYHAVCIQDTEELKQLATECDEELQATPYCLDTVLWDKCNVTGQTECGIQTCMAELSYNNYKSYEAVCEHAAANQINFPTKR